MQRTPIKKPRCQEGAWPRKRRPRSPSQSRPVLRQSSVSTCPRFLRNRVTSSERSLCVACVWQIFTRAMSLAPKTALAEMKRYTPTFEELTSAEAVRPFFRQDSRQATVSLLRIARQMAGAHRDPSHRKRQSHRCASAQPGEVAAQSGRSVRGVGAEGHAAARVFRVAGEDQREPGSGRSSVAARRLAALLSRKEPKVNWQAEFAGVHSIRRSRRLGAEQERRRSPGKSERPSVPRAHAVR